MNVRKLFSSPLSRTRSRRSIGAPRRTRRPVIEDLEGRRLLATNIFEYAASLRASLPAMIVPGSGLPLYITEAGRNSIVVVDPFTLSQTKEISVPTADAAAFGIAEGPDDKVWFTELFGNKIGVLDKATDTIQEFALPTANSTPIGITAGPDGKLWFTEAGNSAIGVIDPTTFVIQEFALPSTGAPIQITAGPDGKLWFTDMLNDAIGVIDPTTHAIEEFDVPGGHTALGITAGSDGKIWFTMPGDGSIGAIDPVTHLFESYDLLTPNSEPTGIVTGADGNLWITQTIGNAIATFDMTTHVVTEYAVPTLLAAPLGITAGADGNLYFTEAFAGKVGRVSFPEAAPGIVPFGVGGQGSVTIEDAQLPNAGGGLYGIVTGPDGKLWFTESISNKIGTIDPTTHVVSHFDIPTTDSRPLGITSLGGKLWFTEGANNIASLDPVTQTFQEFAIPTSNSGPIGITAGPDGKLWFTESFVGQIGVFDPATTTFQEFALPSMSRRPLGIVTGPDGKLWFTEAGAGRIGTIDPTTHVIEEFPLPTSNNGPWSIVAGPDGKLWFTEFAGNRLGSIDPTSHLIEQFSISGFFGSPIGLAVGSDGQLWFTEAVGNRIGSFNLTTHTFNSISVPSILAGPALIAPGPDGNLWFTEFLAGNIGLAQLVAFPIAISLVGPTSPSMVGDPVSFTATVTPGVAGVLDGQVVFMIDGVAAGTVPVKLVGGKYQATFVTSSLSAGTHTVLANYTGDTAFANGQSNSVNAVVQPQVVTDGPTVTSVQRYGIHAQETTLVLNFSRALDPTTALNPQNYRLVGPHGRQIRIREIRYAAGSQSLTLLPVQRLNLHRRYQLTVIGEAPNGVRDTNGLLLDGARTGKPGSNYVTIIDANSLVWGPLAVRANSGHASGRTAKLQSIVKH